MPFKRGDIVYVDFNSKLRTGSEQTGLRPAVIISNNSVNNESDKYIVCPISSRGNANSKYILKISETYTKKESFIHPEHVYSIKKSMVLKKITSLHPIDLAGLNDKLIKQLLVNGDCDTEFERGSIYKIHFPQLQQEILGLIISNNIGNKYSKIITIIPLLESIYFEDFNDYHIHIPSSLSQLPHDSVALITSIKTFSKERFVLKVGHFSSLYFSSVESWIRDLIDV